jgi:hypothetical protein
MGATFIIMTTIKLATMGGLGIGLATGLQFFHEFKLTKKKKGGEEDGIGETIRERAGRIS